MLKVKEIILPVVLGGMKFFELCIMKTRAIFDGFLLVVMTLIPGVMEARRPGLPL